MQISMSGTANPYDNAYMESFFKTLKYEEVHLGNYETYDDAVETHPFFMEEVYNSKPRHFCLGALYPLRTQTRRPFKQQQKLLDRLSLKSR